MLITSDQTLINSDAVQIAFTDNGDPDYAAQVRSFGQSGKYVYVWFQFPPKVTNDSRKATWNEKTDVAATTEPIVLYASSSPREVGIQLTYIYNNEPRIGGGGKWDADLISRQVRLIRGYFHRVTDITNQRNLAIWLRLWGIGGKEEMTFRMLNSEVKYSETMIWDPATDPTAKKAYPFKTDINISLCAWTQGNKIPPAKGMAENLAAAGTAVANAVTGGQTAAEAQQRLTFLAPRITPDWY